MSRPMVSIAHHFYQKIIFFLLAACTLLILAAPAQAERLPDLINKVKPADVFPNATRFGAPEGKPMMAKVYEGDKEVGVVYITTDVVSTRGYSSKPIDTIVALDNEGTIKGAKMLEHHEPIWHPALQSGHFHRRLHRHESHQKPAASGRNALAHRNRRNRYRGGDWRQHRAFCADYHRRIGQTGRQNRSRSQHRRANPSAPFAQYG